MKTITSMKKRCPKCKLIKRRKGNGNGKIKLFRYCSDRRHNATR